MCINAQAYGYQHRRRKMPGLYSLALDLAGPFKQKGRDTEFDDYKYVMVAAYRCPREYMSATAIPEYDKELYVPDEPEELSDDPLELDLELDPGDKLSGGEESDSDPIGPETLEEAVEKLNQGEETATIYVTRPLRRRTAHHVLQAAKEILLQLRQSGLHVDVVHTDRAREFKAKSIKEWTVDSKLRHTNTAGGDPSGNSTAELGVKWAKSRMRALLKGAKMSAKEWPMAVNHASSSLWAKAFPFSPWTTQPATTFGNEVWFRSKVYQGKAEKKHEAVGTRWKKGWYGGPLSEVKRGHVILRDDGGLTIAKSVKFNVIDPDDECHGILPPATAEGLPEESLCDEHKPTRKQLKEEIEFRSRNMLDNKNYSLENVVQLFGLLELLGDTDRRILEKSSFSSWYTGAFVHGGVAGVRNNVRDYPWTNLYLTAFAKHHCGPVNFSAIGLAKNAQLGLRRDVHNSRTSTSYMLPLKNFQGGALWVQDDDVCESEKVTKTLSNGKEISGRLLELEVGRRIEFTPRVWHEVQPWVGDRLVMLLFTPRTSKLSKESVDELNNAGFNVHVPPEGQDEQVSEEEEEIEPIVKAIHIDSGIDLGFVEINDEEFFPSHGTGEAQTSGLLVNKDNEINIRKLLEKAEVHYTPDIENILENLVKSGKTLEVTHNVCLADVRKNLVKWRPSAKKEFENLKDAKQAFVVKKRCDLPANCKIVPSKGVYTVKPDKRPEGFRRKTRFVACGNHVSEDSSSIDLYAAGIDAVSLRAIMTMNAGRKWRTATTDVRQAFVLAEWLGDPVALEPPAIAYELGLAERGDMWQVKQAIYGLRESPALWSKFRDNELRIARWMINLTTSP